MVSPRNDLPTLVCTILLYGGLNQIIFLCLFLRWCDGVLCRGAVGHVHEICCVSASFQGILVVLLGFVEASHVARDSGYTPVYR